MRLSVSSTRVGVVAGLTFGLSMFPMSSAKAVGFSPAGCRIEYMADPHLTSSPGVLSVKANSKIQCNSRVDDLVLTVRLYRADPERQTAKTAADNSNRAYLFNEGDVHAVRHSSADAVVCQGVGLVVRGWEGVLLQSGWDQVQHG